MVAANHDAPRGAQPTDNAPTRQEPTPIPQQATSDGLAADLTRIMRGAFRFARDAGNALHIYEDGRYVPWGAETIWDTTEQLAVTMNQLHKWSTGVADEVAKRIVRTAPALWEQPPDDKINLLNGIFNVATGELEPHTPDFLSPVQLPVWYDPAIATHPDVERFIESTFPPDARDVAYEVLAYTMTPARAAQQAVGLMGEGANGKSIYLHLLAEFLGELNVANVDIQRLCHDKFAVAGLLGKLANVCGDLPATRIRDAATFKQIVGGDRVMVERKYEAAATPSCCGCAAPSSRTRRAWCRRPRCTTVTRRRARRSAG